MTDVRHPEGRRRDTGRGSFGGTIALFCVSSTLGGGLAFVVIISLATMFPSIGLPTLMESGDGLIALAVGAVVQLVPSIVASVVLAVLSRRISSEGAWLTRSALVATAMAVVMALVILAIVNMIEPAPLDAESVLHVARVTTTLALMGLAGGLAGAATTIRLRPRPRTETVAALFT